MRPKLVKIAEELKAKKNTYVDVESWQSIGHMHGIKLVRRLPEE